MSVPDEIEQIIGRHLQPHPEGGYFRETYRSEEQFALDYPYHGRRNYSTCIYFLLTSGTFSAFHKIHQDEIWHFYQGSTIDLHVINPDGRYELIKIGNNWLESEVPQFAVKGGSWFAAEVTARDTFALAGCTVSPGFDFEDFEMAGEAALKRICPDQKMLISRLVRKT